MEVFGAVASTVALVETGLKLYKTLDQFASRYTNAVSELQLLAYHTKSLAKNIQEAEAEVRWGRDLGIYLPDAAKEFNDLCDHVRQSFGKINDLAKRLNNGQSWGQRMRYASSKKEEMDEHRRDLETWKSSLQIYLQILQLSASRKAAIKDKVALDDQRLQIAKLMDANLEATKRYQDLVAAQSTFITTGSRDLTPAQSNNAPRRLLDCADAVARLQQSIDAAIAKWDSPKREDCLDEIWYDNEDVSKQIDRLMRSWRDIKPVTTYPASAQSERYRLPSARYSTASGAFTPQDERVRPQTYRIIRHSDQQNGAYSDSEMSRTQSEAETSSEDERRRRREVEEYRLKYQEQDEMKRRERGDVLIERERRSRESRAKAEGERLTRIEVDLDEEMELLRLERQRVPRGVRDNLELIDRLMERWTA